MHFRLRPLSLTILPKGERATASPTTRALPQPLLPRDKSPARPHGPWQGAYDMPHQPRRDSVRVLAARLRPACGSRRVASAPFRMLQPAGRPPCRALRPLGEGRHNGKSKSVTKGRPCPGRDRKESSKCVCVCVLVLEAVVTRTRRSTAGTEGMSHVMLRRHSHAPKSRATRAVSIRTISVG